MSAYNTLSIRQPCIVCQHLVTLVIQFRFGDTWQHNYLVGDKIRWGGNDVGGSGAASARIEGISEPCPNCGSRDVEYDILVKRDCIIGALALENGRDIPYPNGFIIDE